MSIDTIFGAALGRRRLLQGAAALAAAGAVGGRASAQPATSIELLGNNALFSPDLKTIVESEAKVRLVPGPFQSSVDAVSRLTAPGGTPYDLIISSFDFSQPVVMGRGPGDERTLPIDPALVTNISNINDASKHALSSRDDKFYIVPLVWGFDTVLYNTEQVPADEPLLDSWGLLFEDKYAGKIAWWDTSLNMILAAALYLGNENPAEMSRSDLAEVAKFMISKKKNVRTIYSSLAQGTNLLANGEVVVAFGLVTQRAELERRGVKIAGVRAKEGVLSIIQSGYIPKSSKKAEAACAVINAMLGAPYAKAVARGCGYLSTSKLAADDFTPDERERYGFGLFDGSMKHYPQKMPQNMSAWIETWSRVKSG